MLCLDAGNSRLKFGLFAEGRWMQQGVVDYAVLGDLDRHLPARPERIVACNVAGPQVAQGIGALAYVFASQLIAFYVVAAAFGFIYGGIMPLYAVLARENFPLRMMGTIIGGTSMAGSLGMATGPLFGGWIFDKTGDYGWLYIACFGMGIGAVLIALLFRPFPRLPQVAVSSAN